jgi:hypothetical protein
MTLFESLPTIGNPTLTNRNDEELVELFIAAANALRRALGQSALSVRPPHQTKRKLATPRCILSRPRVVA